MAERREFKSRLRQLIFLYLGKCVLCCAVMPCVSASFLVLSCIYTNWCSTNSPQVAGFHLKFVQGGGGGGGGGKQQISN